MQNQKLTFALLFCLAGSIPVAARASGNHNAFAGIMGAGRASLNQKKWNVAASYFREAIRWEGRNADAHAGLGTAYLHLAEAERAQDEFKAALRLNQHNAEAERGIHQLRKPEEEENAFKALEEQVKSEPGNADLLATYAEELVERSRYEEAQQQAQAALKLKPKLGHAYCALGRVAVHNGKDEEARNYLAIAIKSDKHDDDAFGALGDLDMKAKNYPAAIANYRRSAAIVPDERQWHEKLRDAFTASGDTQSAQQQDAILETLKKDVASK